MESITVTVKILPFEYFTEEVSDLKKDLEIDVPKESTINYLFMKLSEELGYFFQKFIFNSETLSFVENTIAFVNGRAFHNLDDLNTVLSDGDTVIIGRMYTGG